MPRSPSCGRGDRRGRAARVAWSPKNSQKNALKPHPEAATLSGAQMGGPPPTKQKHQSSILSHPDPCASTAGLRHECNTYIRRHLFISLYTHAYIYNIYIYIYTRTYIYIHTYIHISSISYIHRACIIHHISIFVCRISYIICHMSYIIHHATSHHIMWKLFSLRSIFALKLNKQVVAYHIISYQMSHITFTYHTSYTIYIIYHIIPHHFILCHIISCHVMSSHIVSDPIISSRTISHVMIACHSIS